MPDIPQTPPIALVQGERFRFSSEYPEYPDADYTIEAHFNGDDAAAIRDNLKITASYASGWHTFDSAPLLSPGKWIYQLWARHRTAAEGPYFIAQHRLEVRPGLLDGATGGLVSSFNERMLAQLEARLEGRVMADAEDYSIAGRSITRIPFGELQKLRDMYYARVQRERRLIEAGLEPGIRRRVKVSF